MTTKPLTAEEARALRDLCACRAALEECGYTGTLPEGAYDALVERAVRAELERDENRQAAVEWREHSIHMEDGRDAAQLALADGLGNLIHAEIERLKTERDATLRDVAMLREALECARYELDLWVKTYGERGPTVLTAICSVNEKREREAGK
jgi:hypothetical protein